MLRRCSSPFLFRADSNPTQIAASQLHLDALTTEIEPLQAAADMNRPTLQKLTAESEATGVRCMHACLVLSMAPVRDTAYENLNH